MEIRSENPSTSSFVFVAREDDTQLVGRENDPQSTLLTLSPHLQRIALSFVPLRDLARMACLNKQLGAVYKERVKERNKVVAALLKSRFTPEFRRGLRRAETSLPRDLLVDPPVRELCYLKSFFL